MSNFVFEEGRAYAQSLDQSDPMRSFRDAFHHPVQANGETFIYLCGNSLGLQPKGVRGKIDQELNDWSTLGVEGHFHAKNPWMPYHEFLTEAMSKIVGAKPSEVVVMNTLSVNLHLMMVSFYRPTSTRNKIIIEYDAFPSDRYAVESQIRHHGYDPAECLIELKAREGEVCLRDQDILDVIENLGDSLALVMLGNTNYYTGQFFDMAGITKAAHQVGAMAGFDCAHGAGNVNLDLHNSGADFAVWCSYKYLNSGPGSLGGCFVHERHADNAALNRFAGWWGHNKETRFGMRDPFDPISGAEGWQLSNPPILSMAAIKASLDVFEEAGMENLWAKARKITAYMEYLILGLNKQDIQIITPKEMSRRGSQLSIQVKNADRNVFDRITKRGVIADWREPDVIRVSPVPLYVSYEDVYNFVEILKTEIA